MRVTSWLAAAVVLLACADRDTNATSGEAGTMSSTSSAGATSSSTSAPTTTNSSSAADTTATSTGDSSVHIPDCRPAYYGEPHECPGGRFGNTPSENWNEFACAACWCGLACEQDSDCLDPGGTAVPRCLPGNPDAEVPSCWLTCETDEDCPGETVCLDDDLAPRACWLPWRKPGCCEQGGDFCRS